MKCTLRSDNGVLTAEWIILISLFTFGIIGIVATLRDSIAVELGDISQAAGYTQQEYQFNGINAQIDFADRETVYRANGNGTGSEMIDEIEAPSINQTAPR